MARNSKELIIFKSPKINCTAAHLNHHINNIIDPENEYNDILLIFPTNSSKYRKEMTQNLNTMNKTKNYISFEVNNKLFEDYLKTNNNNKYIIIYLQWSSKSNRRKTKIRSMLEEQENDDMNNNKIYDMEIYDECTFSDCCPIIHFWSLFKSILKINNMNNNINRCKSLGLQKIVNNNQLNQKTKKMVKYLINIIQFYDVQWTQIYDILITPSIPQQLLLESIKRCCYSCFAPPITAEYVAVNNNLYAVLLGNIYDPTITKELRLLSCDLIKDVLNIDDNNDNNMTINEYDFWLKVLKEFDIIRCDDTVWDLVSFIIKKYTENAIHLIKENDMKLIQYILNRVILIEEEMILSQTLMAISNILKINGNIFNVYITQKIDISRLINNENNKKYKLLIPGFIASSNLNLSDFFKIFPVVIIYLILFYYNAFGKNLNDQITTYSWMNRIYSLSIGPASKIQILANEIYGIMYNNFLASTQTIN